MNPLLNEMAEPGREVETRPITPARPVWVACVWDYYGGRSREFVAAVAYLETDQLILCDFPDPRLQARDHWMAREHVAPRQTVNLNSGVVITSGLDATQLSDFALRLDATKLASRPAEAPAGEQESADGGLELT